MAAITMSSMRIAPVSQMSHPAASKAVRAVATRSSFQGKAITVSFARKQIISSRVMKIRAVRTHSTDQCHICKGI